MEGIPCNFSGRDDGNVPKSVLREKTWCAGGGGPRGGRGGGGRKQKKNGGQPVRFKKLAPKCKGSESQSSGLAYFIYVLKLCPSGSQHLQASVCANTRSPNAAAGFGP